MCVCVCVCVCVTNKQRTDVMQKVKYFRNKKFLIVHGTADGNRCCRCTAAICIIISTDDADIAITLSLCMYVGV